jgi:hypothetical protein
VFTPDGTAYYPQPELKYGTKTLKISAKIDIGTSGGSKENVGKNPEVVKGELTTGQTNTLSVKADDAKSSKRPKPTDKVDPNEKTKLEYNLENSADPNGYGSFPSKNAGKFSLFSDGVSTGFASKLNTEFSAGVNLGNYHDDFTEPEIPMQGPFTERWVGGNQHRHIEVNRADSDGNLDTSTTRPEAWSLTVGSSEIQMTARAASEPRAVLFRETVAKRPVNIANISYNTSSANLGNYSKNYEVLQTSGRTSNNRFFAKAGDNGFIPQTVTSSFIANTAEYALPRFDLTGSTKTVFVNRFNAPGGPDVSALGVMNYESQEYAANNTLNFRNFIVREPLNTFSTEHAGQFGIRSGSSVRADDYSTNASYYKVNRNPKTLAALTDGYEGNVTHSVNYDNNWITHPIPRSAFQYKWITSSATKGINDTFGYVSNFSTPSGSTSVTQSALPFVSESLSSVDGIVTDFVGLNTLIYDPVNTSTRIASASDGIYANTAIASVPEAERLNSLLLHRNGPFQYPSWKQTRAGQTQVSRELKRNNILSAFEEGGKFSRFVVDLVGNKDKKIKSFLSKTNQTLDNQCVTASKVEPPVSFKYKPIETTVLHNNSEGNPTTLRHSYANNLSSFANEEFINITSYENNKTQAYDRLKNIYTGSSAEAQLINMGYDEVIYPKDVNTGLAKVRGRLNYSETANTDSDHSASLSDGVNGIDRRLDQRRTFWRYQEDKRNRRSLFDVESHFAISHSSQENVLDCEREGVTPRVFATTIPNSQGHNDGYASSLYAFGRTPITFIDCSIHTSSFVANMNLSSTIGGFCGTTTAEDVKALYPDTGELNSPNFQTIIGYGGHGTGSGIPGTMAYQTATQPTASAYYYHRPTNKFLNTTGTLGRMPWRVAELSGKKAWFDSYEEYVSDIRGNAKSYTILPEFRISQHLPYYSDGNFLKQNDKFLTLDGATVTSSANTEKISGQSRGFNEEFFEEYSHTDFQKYFGKFSNDLVLDRVTLQCNAVKKLIPYSGFYPSHRSLQLATLFSQSIGPHVGKNVFTGNGIAWNTGSLAMQALLQPYYAPGIMYNTIKAGVACDWASYTGSFWQAEFAYSGSDANYAGYEEGVGVGGVIRYNSDFRTPFEAILDPLSDIGLPISQSNGSGSLGLLYPTYHYAPRIDNGYVRKPRNSFVDIDTASRKKAQTSNDYRLYKLAVNNFFAEVPNFFIQGNNLSTIASKRQQEVSLVSGTTYYMDVYLEKSDDVVMTDSFLNGTNDVAYQTRTSGTLITYNGQVFGPPAKFGDAISDFNNETCTAYTDAYFDNPELAGPENCGDPAYAPWTPPYYYGKSSLTLKYTADEEDEKGGFSYKKLFEKSYVEYSNNELTELFDKYNKRSSYIAWEVTPSSNGGFECSGSLLTDNLNNYFQAVKTQSTNDWDTGLSPQVSNSVGPGQFYEVSIPDISKGVLTGLNQRPRSSTSYTDIEFAIQNENGRLFVWEQNSNVFTSPDFPLEDNGFIRIKIETDGSVVYQYTNRIATGSLQAPVGPASSSPTLKNYGVDYTTLYKSEKKYDYWRTGDYGELYPDCSLYQSGSTIANAQIGNARNLPAEHDQMRVTASLNTFGIFSEKESKLDKAGNLVEVVDSPNSDRDRWVIYSKMETPILDFSNQPHQEGSHRGMWGGYGEISTGSEGVTFGVEETFKGQFPDGADSLLKKCFDLPEKRKLGQVAEKKNISEAIVAIPFTYEVHNKKSEYAETVQILNKNLFKIDNKLFDYYYNWLETLRNDEKAQDPEKPSESITNMLRTLDKYVLPPELDFITFNTSKEKIDPYVAYVFEFNHELDAEDLADIWQGVMPKIAESAKLSDSSVDNNVFSHATGKREFFHGKKLPPETRWMVFKVKRKANDNYYKLTADSRDDSKFDFRFNVGKLELPYSYNWPYDYFSLVELAEIEVDTDFKTVKAEGEE